jgi:hypothetical protein
MINSITLFGRQGIWPMKTKYLIAIVLLKVFFTQLKASDQLKVGDILLISLPCYSCRLIELETAVPYSHSGIVMKDSSGKLLVAQSLKKVELMSLKSFLEMKKKNSLVGHYRFRGFIGLGKRQLLKLNRLMSQRFYDHFNGLEFDPEYRWDNRDKWGREKLYCSEFIQKWMKPFWGEALAPKPMDFSDYEDIWRRLYRDSLVPQGELGNSPADVVYGESFIKLGFL